MLLAVAPAYMSHLGQDLGIQFRNVLIDIAGAVGTLKHTQAIERKTTGFFLSVLHCLFLVLFSDFNQHL